MATHDYVIANGTGAAVRSDLNNALAAIVSNNSGSTEPSTTYAYQWWADTNDNVLKLRNSANNGWITLRELDGTMLIEDGSAASPGLAFADDTNTGIFSAANNQIGIATSGVERLEIGTSEVVFNDPSNDVDFRVESNGETHMLFVDAGNDRVGIGDPSPSEKLNVAGNVMLEGGDQYLYLTNAGTGNSGIYIRGNTASSYLRSHSTGSFTWEVTGSEKMQLDSSGRLLVGTTSNTNSANLDIQLNTVPATDTYAKLQIRSGNYGYILKGGIKQGAGGQLHFDLNNNGSVSTRMVLDTSGRLLVGTADSPNGIHQDANSTFETYKASGHNMLRVQSDSLSNGQYSLFRAHGNTSGGGSRQVFLGVYKHAAIVNPGPFMLLEAEDGADNYYWTDNSNNLRVSTNNSHIGTTSGSLVGTQTSDSRLKNVGANVSYGLAEVKQLQPKQYALKDDPDVNKLGFIAQEVESIIPEAVFDTNEELDGHQEGDRTKLGMEYVQLIPVLVNAIKELSAEVDTLKTKVAALEAG